MFTAGMYFPSWVLIAGLFRFSGKNAFGAANARLSLSRQPVVDNKSFQWSRVLNETANDTTIFPTHPPTSLSGNEFPTTTPKTNDPSGSTNVDLITDSPSQQPSDAPSTAAPTGKPTIKPTESPSKFPVTLEPSSKPSEKPPTIEPTGQPIIEPTKTPATAPPTNKPTEKPSKPPTTIPTISPTHMPSPVPTQKPSQKTTNKPSRPPTGTPTKFPTLKPSASPISAPSKSPSHRPTRKPSKKPTIEPSHPPTAFPTTLPSFRPSHLPTDRPSRKVGFLNAAFSKRTNKKPKCAGTISRKKRYFVVEMIIIHELAFHHVVFNIFQQTRRPTLAPSTLLPTNKPSSAKPTKHPSSAPTIKVKYLRKCDDIIPFEAIATPYSYANNFSVKEAIKKTLTFAVKTPYHGQSINRAHRNTDIFSHAMAKQIAQHRAYSCYTDTDKRFDKSASVILPKQILTGANSHAF
ncbi:hypothetical protein HJC23_007658 [Cyclotella cryptica]|uniref:Uncharacterized protein n=1 Tax=Cyclotella cryptica TaxID=29204 RepID=A0ABD3NRC2_9STRA